MTREWISKALHVAVSDPPLFLEKVAWRVKRQVRRRRPMRRDYRRRFAMTIRDWLVYHQNDVMFTQTTWMGVTTLKNPCDAWVYQEIIHEVQPDVIVEIGSWNGGSTLYLANILDLLGKGTVVSVDIDRSRFNVSHARIVTVTGDSSAPEIVAQVKDVAAGKRVLVIHDGCHEKTQVLRDLHAYAPMVSSGSYLIVEDGIIDLYRPGDGIGTYEDGPLAALEEFLIQNRDFRVDEARERFISTSNPRGFLRCVRPEPTRVNGTAHVNGAVAVTV